MTLSCIVLVPGILAHTTKHTHNNNTTDDGVWAGFIILMFMLVLLCLSLSWYPSIYTYSSSSNTASAPVVKQSAPDDIAHGPEALTTLTL